MSSYREGQIHQLANALEAGGFTPEDITILGQSPSIIADTLHLVRDFDHIKVDLLPTSTFRHIINCNADPLCQKGWTVVEHKKMGQLEWDPAKVELYLSENQRNDKLIQGNNLQIELASKPVLNVNVLDYLLANPTLIPKEWERNEWGKIRYIPFWGTIFHYINPFPCVCCLFWFEGGWIKVWRPLDNAWGRHAPAACLRK